MKKLLFWSFTYLFVTNLFGQSLSKYIVVDQFGYRPSAKKIAVIRDPQVGFDASESFAPGTSYALVDATTKQEVFTKSPIIWNNAATDSSSGDRAWWFDFSSVTTVGEYYVLDIQNNVKSYTFSIKEGIYDQVLKDAVRTFFYQRAGYEKKYPFAEIGWEDGASHIGPLQDKNCRPYNDLTNASLERDLSGGWYDAGDYNKYTTWTANYIYEMMQSYEENPNAWTDDYDLPTSGNKIPDIIDEAKWGMDHLLRLQNNDGSLISIVSLDHESPPSAAKKQSKYGGVNTSSTWAAASTYAYGAKVFKALGMDKYSDTLKAAAIKAYTWAEANPAVIWRNNDAAYNSSGVGAGQQEVDDYGRLGYRLRSCSHLYEITSDAKYKTYFESNYSDMHLIQWYFAYPYETREQEMLLYYTGLTGINATVKSTILGRYTSGMNGDHNLKALNNKRDPYMAHIDSYTWGSNNTKSNQGSLFMDAIKYNTNASSATLFKNAAEDYVHYIHGVNPLNKCYLSNMSARGAENSVSQFYHSWFKDKSALWDEVGVSTYGPAPGFLVGGPNSSYKKDACCDGGCGGTANNAVCTSFDVSKVIGQPRQKSYADFNTNWPLNSWEVTENSCGYQIAYIKLLSKFVDRSSVINSLDDSFKSEKKLVVYPNPSHGAINIDIPVDFDPISVTITDMAGIQVYSSKYEEDFIMLENVKEGTYILDIQGTKGNVSEKIIVR